MDSTNGQRNASNQDGHAAHAADPAVDREQGPAPDGSQQPAASLHGADAEARPSLTQHNVGNHNATFYDAPWASGYEPYGQQGQQGQHHEHQHHAQHQHQQQQGQQQQGTNEHLEQWLAQQALQQAQSQYNAQELADELDALSMNGTAASSTTQTQTDAYMLERYLDDQQNNLPARLYRPD